MNNKLMPMTLLLAALVGALGSGGCQGHGQAPHTGRSPGLAHVGRSPGPTARMRSTSTSHESLVGISCTSGSDCFLVGTRLRFPKPDLSLTGRWDGSHLSVMPGPNIREPGLRPAGDLIGVTCPNAHDCWAAGRYGNSVYPGGTPFFAHWNGTAWSAVAVPLPRHSDPDAAAISVPSCASATDCWAVGYAGTLGHGGLHFAPLTVHWNGSEWSLAPAPGKGAVSGLSTVSCPAANDCWAIGSWVAELTLARGGTLTEHWNGARWSVVRTPTDNSGTPGDVAGQPAGDTGAGVTDVSCAKPAACVAVGSWRGERAFAERWNGSTWVLAPPPEARGSSASGFDGVSCVTVRWCVAVGDSYIAAAHKDRVLVERWNGTAWTIVPAPAPASAFGLFKVSCVTTRGCVAVGYTGSAPFLDRWNGRLWTVVAG